MMVQGLTIKNLDVDQVKSIVAELEFFKPFPKEFILPFSGKCQILEVEKGCCLLKQGQQNDKLFILLSGNFGVFVDEGRVSNLMQKGDLLGEMSVISSEPCTATLLCEEPSQILMISGDDIRRVVGGDSDKYNHLIFRGYATALSKKIFSTNQRAKHFEQLSYNLQKAQKSLEDANQALEKKVDERTQQLRQKTVDLEHKNSEMLVSFKKIEELYANRDVTFERLENLQKLQLTPLRDQLGEMAKSLAPEVADNFTQVQQMVDGVISMLEPITARYSQEVAMKDRKVLLADSNKKQQTLAKVALGGSGVKLDLAASLDEVQKKLSENKFDVVFFDAELMPATLEFRENNKNTKFVFMTSGAAKEVIEPLKGLSHLPNIVSRHEEDRSFTLKNIITTVSKLVNQDYFGLEKYLSWGVEVKDQFINQSTQRAEAIEGMTNYFTELGVRKSHLSRCQTVAEELLMNAIYDAPTDENGNSLYNHLPRSEPVSLPKEKAAQFRYSTDGMLMAISVSDAYGSLRGKVILDYLESCYGGSAGQLNSEKGGAGRGLHQIIENSDLVVFNVKAKQKTEVISLFHVDPKQSDKSPSFHYFFDE